jgi:hypothetical protein
VLLAKAGASRGVPRWRRLAADIAARLGDFAAASCRQDVVKHTANNRVRVLARISIGFVAPAR